MTEPDGGSCLILGLNAAENILQVVLGRQSGELLYGQWVKAASRGTEMLAPTIAAALQFIEKKPSDIHRIAAVQGPGSFTGLRLTATTAAGLARSVGARQAGLDYMSLIARQASPFLTAQPEKAHLWVMVRARRDLAYLRAFVLDRDASPPLRPITDTLVKTISSGDAARQMLDTALVHGVSRIFMAGSGAHENRNLLVRDLSGTAAPRVTLLDVVNPMPDALFAAACKARYTDNDIEPFYVRASDAEDNLPQIAKRLGLDPDHAVAKLHELTHTQPDAPMDPL